MATIIVTATYSDGAGTPLSGTVTFTPVVTGTDGTVVFLSDPITARVVGGSLSKSLQTTDTWTIPGAVTYKVSEKVGATGRVRYFVSLPSSLGATVDLASLVRFANPPNQIQIDAGGVVDIATHVTALHDALDIIDADHEARIDALEAGGGGGGYVLPVDGIPQSDLDAATETKLNNAIPKTIADAKGDIIVATAADTVVRLPVGSNNQVLTADSAQASGVKWATSGGTHTHIVSDVTGLQTQIDDVVTGLAAKAETGHTHTSADISGTLTLAQLPPGALFVINWVSSAWKYNGATITSRPTARTDLRMWAVGGTTAPSFGITHDMHSPEVP